MSKLKQVMCWLIAYALLCWAVSPAQAGHFADFIEGECELVPVPQVPPPVNVGVK